MKTTISYPNDFFSNNSVPLLDNEFDENDFSDIVAMDSTEDFF